MSVPPTISHDLADEGATAALAASLARLLRPGDVIALSGELGAGKTTLVRAVAAALGVEPGLVSSPTFVVVSQYPIPITSPNPALAGGHVTHADAYRLGADDELDTLGWDRLFTAVGAAGVSVAFIEWPERIAGAIPAAAHARLEATGVSTRRFTLAAPATWTTRPEWEPLSQRPPTRCRVTGRWVEPLSPTYPFADARARDADLYGWFTSSYRTSREPTNDED